MRVGITLACSKCKEENYRTKKNKKNTPDKLEITRYCSRCNSRVKHLEKKK